MEELLKILTVLSYFGDDTQCFNLIFLLFFLQWGAKAFQNMLIVPPGSGIVHQINLEHLARVVFMDGDTLYPDSVVGTDSHTTMINGLGVVGWGVGGM